MTNPWKMTSFAFKRFRGRASVAIVFIVLIPILYGGIYLHANWDLYDNIDNVKVAVVNKDRPVQYEGQTIRAGDMFEDALRQQDAFNWQFMGDDEARARRGLRDSEYYMVVTVPENFSENLVSAGEFDPNRAQITLRTDDSNGFIIGSLMGQAKSQLTAAIDSAVGEAYFSSLFTNLSSMKTALDQAADGSRQLSDGLNQATDGVAQINDAVGAIDTTAIQAQLDELAGAVDATDAATTRTVNGARGIADAAAGLSVPAATVRDGAGQLGSTLGSIRSQVEDSLPDAEQAAVELVEINADLSGGAQGGLVGQSRADLTALRDKITKLRANPNLADDPDFVAELEAGVNASLDRTTEIAGQLNTQGDLAGDVSSNIDTGALRSTLDAADAAAGSMRQAAGELDEVTREISESMDEFDQGLDDLSKASDDLAGVSRRLLADGPSMLAGVVELSNALGQLDSAMPQLAEGGQELADKLESGAEQLPVLSNNDIEALSEIMSSPVSVEHVIDHPADSYGRGLAPMFFSIALWVTSVTYYLVLRAVPGTTMTSRIPAWRRALFGFGPFGAVAVAASLIMGLGCWALLGLDPVHPGLFTLLLVVAVLAFNVFAYFCRVSLGSPQTAVFLILLILQLPASGGTFPPAMLESFYRSIAAVAPMRYSVDAFRVAISGGELSQYWVSIAVLMGMIVVFGALTVWVMHRRQMFRMRDLHPPMATDRTTGEYAFGVRPR